MARLFMQKQWINLVGLFLVFSLESIHEGNYFITFGPQLLYIVPKSVHYLKYVNNKKSCFNTYSERWQENGQTWDIHSTWGKEASLLCQISKNDRRWSWWVLFFENIFAYTFQNNAKTKTANMIFLNK